MQTQIANEKKEFKLSFVTKISKQNLVPIIGLVTVILFFGIASRGRIFTAQNFTAFFNEVFMILLTSCGLIFIIAQGEMDLSVAGVAAICCAIGAYAASVNVNLALPVAIIVGLGLGMLNGFVVSKLKISSFFVTIAISFMLRGIVELILRDGSKSVPYELLEYDKVWIKIIVASVVAIICFILFTYTAYGKWCRAVGSRVEVVRQTGVKVRWVKVSSYMLMGAIAGLIAFFFLTRSGTATAATGSTLQFSAMQALLFGGAVLSGGYSVRFRAVIIGSIIMAVISNGLTICGVESTLQQLVKGVLFIIVVALTFDRKSIEVNK